MKTTSIFTSRICLRIWTRRSRWGTFFRMRPHGPAWRSLTWPEWGNSPAIEPSASMPATSGELSRCFEPQGRPEGRGVASSLFRAAFLRPRRRQDVGQAVVALVAGIFQDRSFELAQDHLA